MTATRFIGLYAQDSWRISPKLTLVMVCAWEHSKPWAEVNHKTMQFNQRRMPTARYHRL